MQWSRNCKPALKDIIDQSLMAIIKEKEFGKKYKAFWISVSYGCRAKCL
jgi:hypothetical protein